jgi:hypothetical protein
MDRSNVVHTSRRDFIAKIFPGCALSCFVSQRLLGAALFGEVPLSQEEEHKFEKEMDRKITYKRWIQQRHNKYIELLKHLENDIGKERLLEMLKKASYEENVKLGKRLSDRISSLQVFADPFRNETSNLSKTIVREIIEDSDTAFEIRITECLTEIVFREADALDLGYACVCHADFGLPVGINPKLKLIRTKTLMQGHDCCNHRYVWED